MDRMIVRELAAAVAAGLPVVVATVIETDRSVPRRPGSSMLIFGDGRQSGSIGGGEMEARVVEEANAAFAGRRPRTLDFELVDPASGDPGVCGGTVTIYLEPHVATETVYVFGCGHVGRAVIDLAHWLGYRVVAVDDRSELANVENLPNADAVIAGSIHDAIATEPITEETWVVVVTRNAKLDLEIVPVVLQTPARAIGVMGSRRRWKITRNQLREQGVDAAALDQVMSPIGVEIHAETPEEIAVSVMAEITQHRRG